MNRMFRVFGHDRVWVLDGGLPRWRASGYDVESSASGDAILKASAASEAIEKVYHGQAVSLFVIDLSDVLNWCYLPFSCSICVLLQLVCWLRMKSVYASFYCVTVLMRPSCT